MNYREYLATTDLSSDRILADWRWLIGPDLQLWHVTKAGDALLRDPRDGSIHLLDVVFGKVRRIAADDADFTSHVAAPRTAALWLRTLYVDGQAALGMRPAPGECLSLSHPPVLGGTLDPDNFEVCDVAVHLSIAGQIHQQVKDLPAGTRIDEVRIETPNLNTLARRPWWRFW